MLIMKITEGLSKANIFFGVDLPKDEGWEKNKLEETIEKIYESFNELKELKGQLHNDFPNGRLTAGKMLTKNVYNEKKEEEILFNVSLLLTYLKDWMKRYYQFASSTHEYPNCRSFYSSKDGTYKQERDTLNCAPQVLWKEGEELPNKEYSSEEKKEEGMWLTKMASLLYSLLYKSGKELLQLHDK